MSGPDDSRHVVSVAVAVVGVLVLSAALVGAQASYSMSTGNDIDVPQRTVTVEGNEYTVSKLGRTPKGESVQVTVETTDSSYDIYLYKVTSSGVQIEQTKSASGTTTVNFPTDNLSPGSYFAAVYDSNILDLVPVVVSGYDVSASFPRSVERGDTASVSVSVTKTVRQRDPKRVEVVVGDSDHAVRVNATKTSEGYTADVPTNELPAGDYSAYAVTRGENTSEDGRNVVVGVSDATTLTVTEPTPTEAPSSGSGGTDGDSGGGGSGSTGSGGSADTATSSPTVTPDGTPTPTYTESQPTTPSPTTDASPTETTTPVESVTDDGVTTPASPTATQSPTDGGGPGFGLLAALLALAAVALLGRRG